MANVVSLRGESAEALVCHLLHSFDKLVERQCREKRIFHDPVIGGSSGVIAADTGIGNESARVLAGEGGELIASFTHDTARRRR